MDSNLLDEHQDVARSSYADMLHDDERNHAYNEAIRANVFHFVNSKELNPDGNRFYKCCDIGTGSGLLSMMIVRAFRDLEYEHFHVTTFEAFKPMAECAKRIIEANGMSNSITVIPTRSEEYLEENPKFDLLVAELLDTELIGEGCLETYRHANEKLCSSNCVFIPQKANIYIQMIESSIYCNRQHLRGHSHCSSNDNNNISYNLQIPAHISDCCGMPEIDDLQTLSRSDLIRFSEPQVVFYIDFSDINSIKLRDSSIVENPFHGDNSIEEDHICILMWWDVVMYDKLLLKQNIPRGFLDFKENYWFTTLSCQPCWFRENYNRRDEYIKSLYGRDIWREHWIRGIYHLSPRPKGPTIYAYHDSHSMWFSTKPSDKKLPQSCDCGVHRMLSRSELAFLNNTDQHLAQLIAALLLGQISTSAQQIQASIQFNNDSRALDESFGPKWEIHFDGFDEKLLDYSLQADICWKEIFSRSLRGQSIEPIEDVHIYYSQVSFKNLSRIRDKVGICQGFDLSYLDQLIERSSQVVDNPVEPHFLWEYESNYIESAHLFSMNEIITSARPEKHFNVCQDVQVHFGPPRQRALVFWCKFLIGENMSISTGPVNCEKLSTHDYIQWNKNYKQLVYFLDDSKSSPKDSRRSLKVELSSKGLRVIEAYQ